MSADVAATNDVNMRNPGGQGRGTREERNDLCIRIIAHRTALPTGV